MFVFGLGNPGSKYEGTRHNVGFETLERLAALKSVKLRKRCFCLYKRASFDDITLVEPLTYMNNSGDIIPGLVPEEEPLIVIVDQMDLEPGRLKIKKGGSSAGHNCLKSIIAHHGEDFIRVYIGTGRPKAGIDVCDHVLSCFDSEDRMKVDQAEKVAVESILAIIQGEKLESVIQKANTFRAN